VADTDKHKANKYRQDWDKNVSKSDRCLMFVKTQESHDLIVKDKKSNLGDTKPRSITNPSGSVKAR